MNFTSLTWCELAWTQWIKFTDRSAFKQIPSLPGVYRIRAINGNELFYIGETGRNLRERLASLRVNTMKTIMPYNTPHTAAPSLWAWRDADNIDFECSAAVAILATDSEEAQKRRKGLEFYLLWQYRLEFGFSTRCNHGRFHSNYIKSTDSQQGIQGYRLAEHEARNIAGGQSLPPLQLKGTPFDCYWMGLSWSTPKILHAISVQQVPFLPGLYKIFDIETNTHLYIGETKNLRSRLRSHIGKPWECSTPLFSYSSLPHETPEYQRLELENDLLGGFYADTKALPKFQLVNLARLQSK